MKAVGFVAGGKAALAKADYGEALGSPQARTMPPIAADGPAGDVLRSLVADIFVDVSVALKNGENVAALEQIENIGSVGDGESVVFAAGGDDLSVGGEGGDHWAVNNADDGSAGAGGFQVGGEPVELVVVNAAFP